MTLRPRSAVWTCALAAAAAFFAVAALELGSGTSASAAPTQVRGSDFQAKRGPAYRRRHRTLVSALRRKSVRAGHATVAADAQPDATPAPCAPTLFAPPAFDMNEGTTTSLLPLSAGAGLSSVMLFVDFPDVRATESTTQLHNRLVPDARAWYEEASNGRAALDVTSIPRWFRMPRGSRDYGLGNGPTFDEHKDYIADAIAAADADVDFSRYRIVYVVAVRGSALKRSSAFHTMPGSGIAVDGVEVRYSTTLGEDAHELFSPRYGSNVLIHETGHLLGLPDLYDEAATEYPGVLRFAGGWDMMSSTGPGAHFFAWHKWKLGWLDQTQLTCLNSPGEVTATITPASASGGLKAVVVPTGPSTAFVIEARRRTGQDARLCEEGVLVYSVDALARRGNGPIRVQPAQSDRNPDLVNSCGMLYNAPFDRAPGEVARFQNATMTLDVLGSSRAGYRVRVTRR